jgi:hypothetical protein
VKKIYFFIGRTTPPHSGHIHVLCEMIEKAKASKTPALILLGDGPNGGQRTRDNPISHETKAAFIQEKLSSLNYQAKIDFVIEKMKQPPNKQVVEFVNGLFEKRLIDEARDKRIEIIQVAGKKGLKTDSHAGAAGDPKYDDLEKHSFVRKGACKELSIEHRNIVFKCDEVEGVDAISGSGSLGEMSATKVRNAAVGCFTEQGESGSDHAFECWLKRFPYYRGSAYSRNIFDEIIMYKDTEQTAHKKLTAVRSARMSPSPSSSSKKGSRSRPGRNRERSRTPSKGGSRRRNRRHKITRRLNRRTRGRGRGRGRH